MFSPSLVDHEGSEGKFETVEILVLDEVLQDQRLDSVRMMKIDVEGFELNVLKGAKQLLSGKNAPIICIEYVKRLQKLNQGDTSIFDYLRDNCQYRIFQMEKGCDTISRLVEIKEEAKLRDNDNLFCFSEGHLKEKSLQSLFN